MPIRPKLLFKPAVIAVILPVIIAAVCLAVIKEPLMILACAFFLMAVIAWLIIHFKLLSLCMITLAFLLPFSVEIPVMYESMLRIPTEPLIAIGAIILVFDVLMNYRKLKSIYPVKELLWVLPLVMAFLVTLPFSGMHFVSLKFSMVNIIYIMVFFVLLSRLSMEHPGLFPRMLLLYGIGFIIAMLWGVFNYWQYDWNPVVVRGIFQPFYKDHTVFGASAAVLGAFWLASAFYKKNKASMLVYLTMGMVFAGCVLLSTSRAAFISLLFFFIIMVMLSLKVRPVHLAGMLVSLIIVAVAVSQPLTERMKKVEEVSYADDPGLTDRSRSISNISTDVSNIERLNRWISAWRMFREKPLTGFGPGTYQFVYIPYQEPALENRLTVTDPWNVPEGSGGTAHSEYLLAMSEMGVWGLLGWLVLIGRWVFLAFNTKKQHPRRMEIIVAFAALSTYLLHAFFNNFLTTDKFAFLFWGTAAWMIANNYANNEQELLQTD